MACVIIGNGPSAVALQPKLARQVAQVPIIGLNRAWQIVPCDELVIADYNMLKPEEEPGPGPADCPVRIWTLAERLSLSQWEDKGNRCIIPLRQSVELWDPPIAERLRAGCRCSWHLALQVAYSLGETRAVMIGFDLSVGEGMNKERPFAEVSREGQLALAMELAAYRIPLEVGLYPYSPLAEAGLGKQLDSWQEVEAWLS